MRSPGACGRAGAESTAEPSSSTTVRPAAAVGLAAVEHDVHGEAVEPGAERALAAEQRQLLPRADEHVLRELLGERAVGGHAGAERVDARRVRPVQPPERLLVAGRRAGGVAGVGEADWVGAGGERSSVATIGCVRALGSHVETARRAGRFERPRRGLR
jgi:hypothetical protein